MTEWSACGPHPGPPHPTLPRRQAGLRPVRFPVCPPPGSCSLEVELGVWSSWGLWKGPVQASCHNESLLRRRPAFVPFPQPEPHLLLDVVLHLEDSSS